MEQRTVHLITRQHQPDGSWLLRDYKDLTETVPFPSLGTDSLPLRNLLAHFLSRLIRLFPYHRPNACNQETTIQRYLKVLS